ncbi:sporulation protein YabP [Clostridium swellfunianum]|uniref:sporulation protein YabP n=1 Tax=Clostridium swellfunianum TaxID=1367462 RepID=UPI00202FC5AD|nr:sporulation protein YabP [Clostridium swellfunianum]MCM0649005.1 sporulation protein YabP [Clostridium swellfunianum]
MELKKDIKVEEKKSNLVLENRKRLALTGVVEVISFNETVIMLNTCLGSMTIKGEGLRMNKLDVQNGEVMIVGTINSCVYSGVEIKKDEESIFKKLFK